MTVTEQSLEFRPGDWVEVLGPDEILETLDGEGTLDGLPFMPEMVDYCGKRFAVSRRIAKTCVVCPLSVGAESPHMKAFLNDNVVFLENLRCDGSAHAGCGRACMLFWKTQWLKKVDGPSKAPASDGAAAERLVSRLKTKHGETHYFCQSTQLWTATSSMSVLKRLAAMPSEVVSNGLSIFSAIGAILFPVGRRFMRTVRTGSTAQTTPSASLALRPNEIVEVKPYSEIAATLDRKGANKGLIFVADMKRFCGARFRVRSRVERMILEDSGKMITSKNTVILESTTCDYTHRFAGCPRLEFFYWREIWLRRVDESPASRPSNQRELASDSAVR